MSFLGFGVRAPLATLALVSVLGAITETGLYALLRKSVSESQLTGAR